MTPYEFAVAKVKEAGELVVNLREAAFQINTKNNDPRDIVTSVDLEVNNFLIDAIKQNFPDHGMYSEEGSFATDTKEYMWVIDPIDGTSNFSRGIPHYATCIGLLQHGVPIVGVVYNPVTKELFSFEKGKGAYLNNKPIHASSETSLSKAHVFLHAGRNKDLWVWGGESYTQLLQNAHKTSNFGGSALDMCFIAAGRIEAVVYGTLTTMDIAGALGIVTEAGGVVITGSGETAPFSTERQKIIGANNADIAKALIAII